MAYTNAPANAWAGWRYRIPGGPIGGQYHGYIAPDDFVNFVGWPAGQNEIYRRMDNPAGLGIYPWHPWDKHQWAGVPLEEGQTVSDFVYRSPAEVRPRPNASGGVNTVRAVQLQRTAGFAVSPGNSRTLGAISPQTNVVSAPHPICPAWGCGPPRNVIGDNQPISEPPPWMGPPPNWPVSPAPSPSVPQPPPPTGPAPTTTVPWGAAGSSGCAVGMYRDAAGNCTSDWRNPYSMYLPLDPSPAPSPVVTSNTCPTGYAMDGNGNCVSSCPAGDTVDSQGNCIPAAASGPMSWLQETTAIGGYNVPNWGLLLGVGAAVMMMRGGKRR